jgi:hypothetical protein
MDGSERRWHKRVKCDVTARGKVMEAPTQSPFWETTISDISESGVRFRTNCFFSVKSRFLINLDIPKTKRITVVTRPAWIRELPNFNQYEIGAQFMEIAEEDKRILRDFIRSMPEQLQA